ncbi:MAG: hypothetical protein JWO86_9013 [Myxococcaceae bacterium]|jgi:hypothetical protein|nr:hypothetical protein [Myxococcaceae bacterium]MEA2747586.1 hypothetical protein [Myxococcales bacterium]
MRYRACILGTLLAISTACAPGCVGSDQSDDEDVTVEGEESSGSALTASDYPVPNLTADEKAAVFAQYHVDPNGIVPKTMLVDAVAFFDANKAKIKNKAYLTVVDFSKHSGKDRLFVVNMTTGAVQPHVVAHGSGSDPGNTGYATRFSNVNNSNQSSLGYYVTGETYNGKHGNSLRLDGVSPTNSNARMRAVVMHGAAYVEEGRSRQGRSWGCLALPESEKDAVIAKLKVGSVIYAAH